MIFILSQGSENRKVMAYLIMELAFLTVLLIIALWVFPIKRLKQRVVSLHYNSRNENRGAPKICGLEKNLCQLMIDKENFFSLILDSTSEAMCGFDMEWRCVFPHDSVIKKGLYVKCI